MSCKTNTSVPSGPMPLLILQQRQQICDACEHNKHGVCKVISRRHASAKAIIADGIKRGSLKCPVAKWNSIKRICPGCNRRIEVDEISNVCRWCDVKQKCGGRGGAAGSKFRKGNPFSLTQGKAMWISAEDLARDAVRLSQLIPAETKAIVGVARSGITPANIVATMRHLPLLAVRQTLNDVIEVGNGWRMGGNNHVKIKPHEMVVVVDDTVMTGNSFISIQDIVSRTFPRHKTAACYVNPLAKKKPDIWIRELPAPHILEWNIFNSVYSPSIAVDFDGVLCDDCPPGDDDDGRKYIEFLTNARPKYVVRKATIPLIVTARLEKYRAITNEWLQRHGITCHRLVMHPAATLAERRRDDIAAFKAREYLGWVTSHRANPAPAMFVESEDRQAQRIAQLSGRLVVCPSSRQVYGDPRQ